MLNSVLATLGVISLLILSLAAVFAAYASLQEVLGRRQADHDDRVGREARRQLGCLIESSSHWFAEDVASWKALQVVGREITRTGHFDVSRCRDLWREAVREETSGVAD